MTLYAACDPLSRESFEAAELAAHFPPRLKHPNKIRVQAIACPPGTIACGRLELTRWPERPLPLQIEADSTVFEPREAVFDYRPTSDPDTHWHLNFAHQQLFAFYGGPLLAQDELQVAEHPILASLRESLVSGHGVTKPLTVEDGAPTPVLVKGVERRCRIDPAALYGSRFARADPATLERGVVRLDPPTVSQIIAIEAPAGGSGLYRSLEIDNILSAAYAAFAAARAESTGGRAVVHTGFWGCGAYGGDRVLMTMLQLIAARAAGLERLVFHTIDAEGSAVWRDAEARTAKLLATTRKISELRSKVLAMRFHWGVSNGT